MRPSFYNDATYRKNQSSITKELWQKGRYNHLIKSLIIRHCQNRKCGTSFSIKPYIPKIFCSKSCSVTVNNLKRRAIMQKNCITCGKSLLKRNSSKFCSIKCQQLLYYNQYITRWKQDLEHGNRGINAKALSKYLRRYLLEKYQGKCSICGWNEKHPVTNLIPLEVDHIDGNAENNKEENLRLICPNCHSLSSNFRNLNKGNGREWRIKYLKRHKSLT